jgi:hypothetical protein
MKFGMSELERSAGTKVEITNKNKRISGETSKNLGENFPGFETVFQNLEIRWSTNRLPMALTDCLDKELTSRTVILSSIKSWNRLNPLWKCPLTKIRTLNNWQIIQASLLYLLVKTQLLKERLELDQGQQGESEGFAWSDLQEQVPIVAWMWSVRNWKD